MNITTMRDLFEGLTKAINDRDVDLIFEMRSQVEQWMMEEAERVAITDMLDAIIDVTEGAEI